MMVDQPAWPLPPLWNHGTSDADDWRSHAWHRVEARFAVVRCSALEPYFGELLVLEEVTTAPERRPSTPRPLRRSA